MTILQSTDYFFNNDTVTDDPDYDALVSYYDSFLKVHQIAIPCATVGLCGALMTLCTVLSQPNLRRSHSHRLIGYFAFADLLVLSIHLSDHCVSYSHRDFPLQPGDSLPGGSADSPNCQAVGFLFYWWLISAVIWAFVFPVNIVSRTEFRYTLPDWVSMVCTWGLGLLLALIGIGSPVKYGGGDVFYCFWLDLNWGFYFFIIPFLLSFVGLIALYGFFAIRLFSSFSRTSVGESGKKKYRKVLYKLGLFPFIFLITWLPYALRSIWWQAEPQGPPIELVYFIVSIANLGGFFNWLAYAVGNGRIRALYASWFRHGFRNVSTQSTSEGTVMSGSVKSKGFSSRSASS